MQTIIIGSKNPVKAAVVENAFKKAFPEESFEFIVHSAPSGVSDQPIGWEETKQGAHNRAQACAEAFPEADFSTGLEGGIEILDDDYWVTAWMCIRSKSGKESFGRTGSFMLPPEVVKLIQDGKELAHATDEIFSASNSGYKQGIIGFLTDNVIDRSRYYENAMVYALIPFIRTELYPEPTA